MDVERIAKYTLGIAETSPRHTDHSRGDFAAPPLIVATVVIPTTGMMLADVELGDLNLSRIVHGGIELEFARLVRQDDVLTCTATFDGIEEKSTGTLINFRFDVNDQRDELVCSGLTQYFVRGGGKSNAKGDPDGHAHDEVLHEVSETIEEGLSRLYAEGSGDVFPIHTNSEFAKSVGLPDVILHGMCTLAVALRSVVTSMLDGDAGKLRSVAVRFSKMVFHGDTLTTRIHAAGPGAASFTTLNHKGQPVLKQGRVTFDA